MRRGMHGGKVGCRGLHAARVKDAAHMCINPCRTCTARVTCMPWLGLEHGGLWGPWRGMRSLRLSAGDSCPPFLQPHAPLVQPCCHAPRPDAPGPGREGMPGAWVTWRAPSLAPCRGRTCPPQVGPQGCLACCCQTAWRAAPGNNMSGELHQGMPCDHKSGAKECRMSLCFSHSIVISSANPPVHVACVLPQHQAPDSAPSAEAHCK